MIKHTFLLIALAFLAFSCTAKKEINYMKDIEQIAVETSMKNSRSTIQPGDQIMIYVMAKDMSVTTPFNQGYTGSTISQGSNSGNNQSNSQNTLGPTYIVDTDGIITMNVLGKIPTTGLNLEDLRDDLQNRLSRYIKNPTVNIRNTNYKITVLGEVNKPNTYTVPDGNITILSALGLAGDLTQYGVRQNVLVVRNINGQVTKERIDLTSANFINSPVYYLKQNDVIYVEANSTKEKTARQDPNTGMYITVASLAVSIIIGLVSLLKK